MRKVFNAIEEAKREVVWGFAAADNQWVCGFLVTNPQYPDRGRGLLPGGGSGMLRHLRQSLPDAVPDV
jgi:hypothetical protein